MLIRFNRPEKKNALTVAMYQAMADAINAAKDDPAVRAVLVTGQPGIFTSGNDIEDFMTRAPGEGSDGQDSPVFQFMRALIGIDKPVVAAVTGAAVGIGTTLLLHCDLVYVSDEARLAMPFVSLGLVPEFGSSLVVPRLLGNARAAEKLLLGDPIKSLGALSEPECRRVIAALDLASSLGVPVEWYSLSAGARISMTSGTENMDWVAAALKRIVEFTQAGGEINIVVAGINVGAQPYWNAEATMLMHTRGILVMTPDSAMVLRPSLRAKRIKAWARWRCPAVTMAACWLSWACQSAGTGLASAR